MRQIKNILQDKIGYLRNKMKGSDQKMQTIRTEGYCPICEQESIFVSEDAWLRDHYKCNRCKSIPRWRALIQVLNTYFPEWKAMSIHESSPGGAASDKLKRECVNYSYSYYFENVETGTMHHGHRCENLEALTYKNDTFDMIITQDVLEHIFDVDKALNEIKRVLKPGGCHLFTVPLYRNKLTQLRAKRKSNGIEYLYPPEYHGNPVDKKGALVTRQWGYDICDIIFKESDMSTTIILLMDKEKGIEGEFLEVFISRK